MLKSPVGLDLRKAVLVIPRKKLKSTEPTSRQRGRPTSANPKKKKDSMV
jgi:hypothetical protein